MMELKARNKMEEKALEVLKELGPDRVHGWVREILTDMALREEEEAEG